MALGITVLPKEDNGLPQIIQNMFSEFQRRKEVDQRAKDDERRFQQEQGALDPVRKSQAGTNEAQTAKTKFEMLKDRANQMTGALFARGDDLAKKGYHEEAAKTIVDGIKGIDDRLAAVADRNPDAATLRDLIHESSWARMNGGVDTPADSALRNTASTMNDITGRSANAHGVVSPTSGATASDMFATTKLGGAEMTAPVFADVQQQGEGAPQHSAFTKVQGDLAPKADAVLQAQTSRQNQESSNATQVKVAGMNADARETAAEVRGAAAGSKPMSGESAKVLSIAQTMQPEIEELKKAFESDYSGTTQRLLTGSDRNLSRLFDSVSDKVGRLRSGGAINKDEEAKFRRSIASWMDIPFGKEGDVTSSLDRLMTEAQSVERGVSGGANNGGVTVIRYDKDGNRIQ